MTARVTEGYAYHGPHVLPAGATAERVQWRPLRPRGERHRVLRWTCRCRSTVYYLVAGGGQMHIRRTGPGGRVETDRMRHVHALELWRRLLLGDAV
ncbi:hypothetical protein Sru01_24660 [Sphaerisporangium rufum]|uniref:Uncharacterized protein n=1 Tax=Sphaerisporangium rufum TaxID=1381558 RepID=A0A919R0E4_9ACTN|nr:hypothetical protein [Sphaerisporangium rufum]GII77484.1 hypothetical protein Sru01_24660 [Sphaerisporangium rufum]